MRKCAFDLIVADNSWGWRLRHLSATHGNIIVIGASTGGPIALRSIFSEFPEIFPPVLVAQHMPEMFSNILVRQLNSENQFTIKVAENGESLRGSTVYFAPGAHDMELIMDEMGYRILLTQKHELGFSVPSVDKLFSSVAENFGGKAVGVLLTGIGKDGASGLLQLKKAGAETIVQDEQSSLVYGMAKAAMLLGAADIEVPLQKIVREIKSALESLESHLTVLPEVDS